MCLPILNIRTCRDRGGRSCRRADVPVVWKPPRGEPLRGPTHIQVSSMMQGYAKDTC